MNTKKYGKVVISVVVLFCLLISTTQAFNISTVDKIDKTIENRGWYMKPSYPNYAPQGLPDFSQQQDQWKKIAPGPNNVIDSTVAGDDIYNPTENCIASGPDCALNSTAVSDDVEEWAFCGPVALANCFWWFDSKFADPVGTPGDGQDQFVLVQDYGAGDDHVSTNAPLLIENLARAMNTTDKGTTYIDDMHTAISEWLTTTGLTDKFTVQTYDRPTFSFIENEIERSQDVILLLGDYDYIIGPLMVDQSQMLGPVLKVLQINPMWDSQAFVPTVTRLDAIEILLQSVSTFPSTDVQMNVYDNRPGTLLGTSIVKPDFLPVQTWIRFDFNPAITLTPGATYYFDVHQLVEDPHYYWSYDVGNPYPGQAWKDNVTSSIDWAFQTEYLNPPPHSERKAGHYVTCAGVNSEELKIAFSDPMVDITNPSPNDHNDAAYVSHDIYNVSIDPPQPDINTQWWLTDYEVGYNYTVVEQAVVVCPVPDTTPPTLIITKPKNALYFLNREIMPLANGTLIIGPIDVDVTATDNDSGIDRVEFYVNDQILQGSDTTAPYSWLWNKRALFRQTLIVKAFDKEGNVNSKEIEVWKFF